jgi:hypothetical protein
MKSFEAVVRRLERIAKANHIQFEYRISAIPTPSKMVYLFTCNDCAFSPTFVGASGDSPDEAANSAAENISLACEKLGYRQ